MYNPAELKSWLALSASISTVLLYLSGTLVCQKIAKNKSCGDISGLPFVCAFMSTSLWLKYGFLIEDQSLIFVNTLGATLNFAYAVTFYIYSIKKSIIVRQFLGSVLVIFAVIWYADYSAADDFRLRFVGFVCCIVTIVFFASPLTSLVYVIKMKSADSLPFPIILMTFIVSLQWFLYGLLLSDQFIQVPNFLGCVLSAFQLLLFYIFPKVRTIDYSALQNSEL